MWSYLLTAAGVTGLLVAANRPRLGWCINIAAQALWVAYALATTQYGFLAAAAIYGTAYARLLRRAVRERRRTDGRVAQATVHGGTRTLRCRPWALESGSDHSASESAAAAA